MTGLTATIDFRSEMQTPRLQLIRTGGVHMRDYIDGHKLYFSRQLIKEPSMSVFYRELRDCLPEAKFIMVMRDPRDNIRSILNRHRFRGDQPDLTREQWEGLSAAWRLIYDGSWLGLEGENYIDMHAARWNLIADDYLNNKDDMLLARYETFSQDKLGSIRALAQALELEEKHDIAHRVDVPFQPRGDKNVNLVEFFGDNLQRIESICGERLREFDYAPTIAQ